MSQLTIEQAFQVAVGHHQAGRLAQAEGLYRQILGHQPNHAEALHLLGVIAQQVGKADIAINLIQRAIALKPSYVDAYINLGNALRDRGRREEAIAAYRKAIALKPDSADGHLNLGNALRALGQLEGAIAAYRQAIAARPDMAVARFNLGISLRDAGRLADAVAAFDQAIALQPGYAEAHMNRGVALSDLERHEEAIAAYRRAIELRPGFAEAHNNLGLALNERGQVDDAIQAFRQAVTLYPGFGEACANLGNVLKDRGLLDEAIAAYRRGLAVRPDFTPMHSNLITALNYHPGYDARAIAGELRQWNRQHAEGLRRFIQPHGNDRNPERRLRIGYVSADFWGHASALFLVPLIEHHDTDQVEVYCYAQVPRPDETTRRLQRHAAQWRSTLAFSQDQMARQIRDDRIDILVDLKLHTAQNCLLVFAQRPAPVQVTWLGYPGSTGLSTIDYRLSDPYLDPPGMDESVYAEQTVRLPETFWCYDPLDGREVAVNALPALANGHVTFGCLNNFCKVNDGVLRLWARVLRAAPASRLTLFAPEGEAHRHVLELLAAEGIASERIHFVSRRKRREYLELYHGIDVGLDTFPYNGHTTSLDSFWMGVPVVTLAGQSAVGRAGVSQLLNLKLPELIAATADDYLRIAADMAGDWRRLADLRAGLRGWMEQSPLMDGVSFARHMEHAFRAMWRNWCMAAGRD